MMIEFTLAQFLDQLASSAPTPGGGSAAAMIGATSAALISMVCNVTLGKKGSTETVLREMQSVLAASEKLRARLTGMVQEDVSAFNELMQAYRLPKATDEEKTQRTARIQLTLKKATQAPLDCAMVCAEVIAVARRAAEHGFSGVISDVGVGVLAAQAAMRSASLNVEINVPNLEDRAFVQHARDELERVIDFGRRESEAVFTLVRSRLG
jgi:formiminotetrahydrofolate cyclodeaminase